MGQTSGDTIVLCRHCPSPIEQDEDGIWKDRAGHAGCQSDGLFTGGEPLRHCPLPVGMRGGA